MDSEKKRGIILILIGLLIPVAALPFVTGFSKDKSFSENFFSVGIQIRENSKENEPVQVATKNDGTNQKVKVTWSQLMPRRIQLRFLLIFTVILVYMGINRIERSRRSKNSS